MLSPIDDAPVSATASASSGVDKQIVATGTNNGTIVYTVPAGRKFVGWASNDTQQNGSYWVSLEKDGVAVRHYSQFSWNPTSYQTIPAPVLTLLAGTVVKVGNGNTVYVFGVESDA
tara:strand:+ start:1105 stop:1452 length:348 start_codon:yes stop_codon:yes gene_type:complete